MRVNELVRRSTLLVPVGAGAALVRAGWQVPAALGGRPAGDRLARMRASPNYRDGAFHNTVPANVTPPTGALRDMAFGAERRRPTAPVPLVRPDFTTRPDGLRVSWFGHATVLVELDGRRILFDPVWSERASPSAVLGPRRLHPVPVPLEDLPPVDAVVISHDHYDHLDMATIRRSAALWPEARFVVPLGVGAHLERWRVPPSRVDELDWTETATVGGVELTATAARHFSGRLRPGGNGTLWASWVVAGAGQRVFYTGDSGFFDGYREIGERYGPFDVTFIQIGAYSPYWPDIHMTPEEGVATHRAVGGGLLVPVHWATFNLAMHAWSEPVERLLTDAARHDVQVAVPRPGELLSVADAPDPDGWWRKIA
ncbi:MBL fold metallo-hydrolase [Actinophytocola gossypii]|uniref:MBL fold metallo-hydrolase n=1 Tax=Actinophytocola gossypii TaxID=2812003 RepID=A0ABT2JL45_9PSEU|nr:MBL fold metallo-hydrolase [Actinophytocola gossypii]MCT2588115.1 MBL fold metallo-hydrolase [Actinophytocola gossypii]